MHIRISPLDTPAEDTITQLEQRTGLVSAYALRPMDRPQPVLVSVWESQEQADQASITAAGHDYTDCSFEGTGRGDERPAYGQIVYFDGPHSQSEADAIDRANRERIAPAVRDVPGNLGAYRGRNPDGSSVVVALTASLQAIEDSQRAIMSTELLPGEDPALLTGPDRIQLCWVLGTSLPAGLPA